MNGLRLDEDQCRFHPGQSRRKITQNNLSEAANRGGVLLFQNGKLLPKSQVFQEQVAARRTRRSNKSFSQRSMSQL
jgi:hypothetical protein